MCSSVDTYGFALSGLTTDEIRVRQQHLDKSENRTAVWEKFNLKLSHSRRRFKDAIRRGIPSKFRPDAWMQLSGATERKSDAPMYYYRDLVEQNHIRSHGLDAEEMRLFGKNLGTMGLMTVRRLLTAYERHYHREAPKGTPSIAAYLVVVVGSKREEDAFWLLIGLEETILRLDASNEFGFWCRLQEKILGKLLKSKSPILAEHVEKFASLWKISERWFTSLFVTTFPSETVARIWDCLFFEGPKILQRVALATLIRNENTILSISYSVNLPKILTYKLRRVFDANDLMMTAFRSVGSMKSARLAWMKEEAEKEMTERGSLLTKKLDGGQRIRREIRD